jgi:hypothetical protein
MLHILQLQPIDKRKEQDPEEVGNEHPENGEIKNYPNVNRADDQTDAHLDASQHMQHRLVELLTISLHVTDHCTIRMLQARIPKILTFQHFLKDQQNQRIPDLVAGDLELKVAIVPNQRSQEHGHKDRGEQQPSCCRARIGPFKKIVHSLRHEVSRGEADYRVTCQDGGQLKQLDLECFE